MQVLEASVEHGADIAAAAAEPANGAEPAAAPASGADSLPDVVAGNAAEPAALSVGKPSSVAASQVRLTAVGYTFWSR